MLPLSTFAYKLIITVYSSSTPPGCPENFFKEALSVRMQSEVETRWCTRGVYMHPIEQEGSLDFTYHDSSTGVESWNRGDCILIPQMHTCTACWGLWIGG